MARDHAQLWNASPLPAMVIDGENRIADLNAAAETYFSLSAGAARGRQLARYAGEGGMLLELVAQVRRGVESLAQYNVDLAWADQPPRRADLHAAPVDEASGEVLLIVQPRSIAEKMDRSLTHRSAARSVVGMAAMLAHEIKNPLAGISGAAQLLAMSLPDQDQELTDLIREEAERIQKLLERVEQFGDIRPARREPVNIHDVLTRAKLSAKSGFAQHCRFIEEFDPSLPPTPGDPDQLMQVLLNLIKNAAEATPRVGGIITLRTSFLPGVKLSLPGGRRESLPLLVTISDNGSGVPAEIKADIFEPFVTSKVTGSGLGLALVSKIVADHGGIVECESEPGWTTFRLLLPIWSEREELRRGRLGGGA
jgi:two-component system nitrogen regulation sensor histidine kinase GlnL